MVKKNKFEWKILAKKVGIQSLIIIAAGLASVYGDNPAYLAIAPVITGIVNYMKNK